MSEPGTSYTAEITTPSGLTFHASIYVPPDAEHADQHELSEVAQAMCTRMLISHEKAVEWRRQRDIEAASSCPHVLERDGLTFTCVKPLDHDPPHVDEGGFEWFEPPPF